MRKTCYGSQTFGACIHVKNFPLIYVGLIMLTISRLSRLNNTPQILFANLLSPLLRKPRPLKSLKAFEIVSRILSSMSKIIRILISHLEVAIADSS
uniref:Exosome complex exonuclease RRP46 homolog isoform X2 n=1 Tax=Rhizophora mucronata TaxID=61149 RepID=A0A2P2KW34_RHIMU